MAADAAEHEATVAADAGDDHAAAVVDMVDARAAHTCSTLRQVIV
jgi:hypothetical protein